MQPRIDNPVMTAPGAMALQQITGEWVSQLIPSSREALQIA